MTNATATECTDHKGTDCPDWKPFRHNCIDCGKQHCSNLDKAFQCRDCYLMDEYYAGLL